MMRQESIYCENCGHENESGKKYCSNCGHSHYEITDQPGIRQTTLGKSGYLISFLVPIVGIVLGLIYIAKDEQIYGRNLIFTAISPIAFVLIARYIYVMSL